VAKRRPQPTGGPDETRAVAFSIATLALIGVEDHLRFCWCPHLYTAQGGSASPPEAAFSAD